MHRSVAIHTDGTVSCAAIPWRFRGRLQLTVVVKATFAIAPDGVATPIAPRDILREDRTFDGNPTRSVEAASDLAPYLGRCDVTFVGHAFAPGGQAAPSGSVRIGIARDDRPLLDKTLHVYGDRPSAGAAPQPFTRMPLVYERALGGPGEPNPVGVETPNVVDAVDPKKPGGFGPISRFWAARKRLLGKIDRAALDAPIAEIPEVMPWEYFQAAPLDQQIEHLRGGEWLVLDGLHSAHPRLQTRLPPARGAARVLVAPGGTPIPVELSGDTLAIDGDARVLTLSWRGRWDVAGSEEALSSVRVLAALESPDRPVDWAHLAARPPVSKPGAPPERERPAGPAGEGTLAVSDAAARSPATPFRPATPPVGESTLGLRPDQHAAARERPVAPFALPPEAPPRAPAAPIPGAPWSGVVARATPVSQPGAATLAPRSEKLELPTPQPPVAPPPMVVAPPVATPPAAPPPVAAPPPLAAPSDAPRAVAPPLAGPPGPVAATARAAGPVKKAPSPRDPDAIASQLRSAGASDDDVAALLRALRPPPPPPPDDE